MFSFHNCSSRRFSSALLLSFSVFALGACSRTGHENADAEFVAKASSGGLAEVKLGQLAQERGASMAVKNFGVKMMTDHTDAGNQLQVVAKGEGMQVAPEETQDDRATYERLNTLSGPAFDQAYAAAMVQDHEQDLVDFEREAIKGQNAAVRKFAADTIPTLRQHLELAKEMAKSVGAPASV
jgi:putative membrane protein